MLNILWQGVDLICCCCFHLSLFLDEGQSLSQEEEEFHIHVPKLPVGGTAHYYGGPQVQQQDLILFCRNISFCCEFILLGHQHKFVLW